MNNDKDEIDNKIKELESEMESPYFWNDKAKARSVIKEIADLKEKKSGAEKYDKGNAIINIISGAGGDDAEDFSAILFSMYLKYIDKKGWDVHLIHEHKNDHGGYRNISFEVIGKNAYGTLKNESGVHRLVRISPFNAKKLRHTSFSLVDVLPKFSKLEEKDFNIDEKDLKIEFTRSGGPGGQNVNKRETAVRIVHAKTGISVISSEERSQEQNKERALSILYAKIFKKAKEEKKSIEESMNTNKETDIKWGNQIRSYVFHPYRMVKDHRTNIETNDVDSVLSGDIDIFINSQKSL